VITSTSMPRVLKHCSAKGLILSEIRTLGILMTP
jgi:hypothetical protein